MNCEQVKRQLGMDCYLTDDGTIGVCTPLTLNDTPVYAFFRQKDDVIFEITDDACIAFESGSKNNHGDRLLGKLKRHLRQFGLESEHSEIAVSVENRNVVSAYAHFLELCIEAIRFINEGVAITEDDWYIIDEVEEVIRRRNSGVEIKHNIKIECDNNIVVHFPLSANSQLIDVIRPHSAATGAALRRHSVVRHAGYGDPMIIIDDTDDPLSARRELGAMESMTAATLFSDLKTGTGPVLFVTRDGLADA